MRSSTCLAFALVASLPTACGGKTGLWDLQASPEPSFIHPTPGDAAPAQETGAAGASAEAGTDSATSDAAPPEGCPLWVPGLGALCTQEGQICAYKTGKFGPCDDVGTNDQNVSRCEEGRWLEIARCVDWSPCPGEPPADGSACTMPGLDCFYSRDTCAPESLVQCDGPIWRHVNPCKPRSVHDCIGLAETLSPDAIVAPQPDKDLSMPAMALAGTQALVTFLRGGGDTPDHDIYGSLLQTAVPSMATLYGEPGFKIGRDAISNPVVAFGRRRFVIGWNANDGWPGSTSGVAGMFVRAMVLGGQPGADVLVDTSALAPTGLALGMDEGWFGYRIPAPADPTKNAANLIALGADEAPVSSTLQTLADETKQEWYAPPVPNALVRVARHAGGYQVAFPAPASGDVWDDSGVVVQFYGWASHSPTQTVRASIGLPARLSLAALRDGSAMIAFTLPGEDADPKAPPFHFVRVNADGKSELLPDPMSDGARLAFGPRVVAAEEGFALLWTTSNPDAPNPEVTMHLSVVGPDGSWANEVTRTLAPLGSDERMDVGYSEVDHALHVVWSPESGMDASPDRVMYQRYVCGVGIK